MSDWISIIEAGYDLASERSAWLNHLLETAAPLMDRGVGVNAQIFHVSATQFAVPDLAVRGLGTPAMLRHFIEKMPPHHVDLVYRRGVPVGTLSEWLFLPAAAKRRQLYGEVQSYLAAKTPANFQDSMGLMAHTGTGWGLVLAAPLAKPERMDETERRRWTRVAAHLAAGLRLRLKFSNLALDSDGVEAILRPDGRVEHASDATKSAGARERLRTAVQQIDRARTHTQRRQPDASLDLWKALVAGQWSLIDHFDTDQRRYVVAVKNDPDMPDPRGLTRRERQIAEFFGMGRHIKEIGYILGLSPSTIANTLTSAQMKLRMGSKAELAGFFSPTGMRARLQETELAGERVALGVQPLADQRRFNALTQAERHVAIALIRGATYAAIASQRSASERTVANQAQAIYRKLGVGSRTELGAALSADLT